MNVIPLGDRPQLMQFGVGDHRVIGTLEMQDKLENKTKEEAGIGHN